MPTALITGASAGIGRSYAEQLAARGYDLVLTARREDRLRELGDRLAREHGRNVEVIAADLGTEDGGAAVERRIRDGAFIDLLINNAGFATRALTSQIDMAAFHSMVHVNILALVRLSSAAMARMLGEGRGAIVNICSGTVFMQMPGNAGYGASKNFVMAFTRHMQVEAQGSGVEVQLLIPGVIATDFHAVANNDLSNFPPQVVMQADDLVAASLRALDMHEPVCIPSLPDIREWDAYVEAEAKIRPNVSRDGVADRYR